jgi:hypothetical protein
MSLTSADQQARLTRAQFGIRYLSAACACVCHSVMLASCLSLSAAASAHTSGETPASAVAITTSHVRAVPH